MKFFLSVALVAVFYSCHSENLKYDKPYFDFDSLVRTQVLTLGQMKASVRKNTSLNGKKDSTVFTPDSTEWKHELDAFQQLDVINKPLYKGNYQRNDYKDNHSNLFVHSYRSKVKSPVPEVRFFYLPDSKKLKHIEALFTEGNWIYTTSRRMMLEVDEFHGRPVIAGYRVHGFQKMMGSDTVTFSIEGKLKYPD